jgi:hypothetical protein
MSRGVRDGTVQLLVFAGCPLAGTARRALEQALTECGLAAYEEIDLLAPETPDELRGWGSPTILVDGKDVTGVAKGDTVGCRVYTGPTKVPEVATIVACIRRGRVPGSAGAP